jgi:phosphatidylglycerol:prolipoprotein diacylglycerol transferase
MRQILIDIPFWLPVRGWVHLPLYSFGTMLLAAYLGCTWLGKRLCRRVGIDPDAFRELVLWMFFFGIIGARLAWLIFEAKERSFWQFFMFWDGGLVFYGAIPGALTGYVLFVDRHLRKKYLYDRWKMADCVAPCLALGLALGRVGCLLNGCCYGEVACERCPAISFPLSGAPRVHLVDRGLQTTAGFTLDREQQRLIDYVEPGSLAEAAGLKAGDAIVKVNGKSVVEQDEQGKEYFGYLHDAFRGSWPRGLNSLALTVQAPDGEPRDLPAIAPRTVGLHPTQIYETISTTLLLFFLLSYFPYRRADGELMVIVMFGYSVHRFLNEMLRSDNEVYADGLTLSQNTSILVFAAAIVLAIAAYRHKASRGRQGPEETARLAGHSGSARS